ncbi:MAG: hypothetical protein ACI8Y9_001682, partial [Paracoccaceae bacterium]
SNGALEYAFNKILILYPFKNSVFFLLNLNSV